MTALDNRTERRWASLDLNEILSNWARHAPSGSGSDGAVDPEVIVFGGGIPDPESLPSAGLIAAARRVLEHDGPGALEYGGTQGELILREWLAERLNRQEDAGVSAEHFVLTNGSGQAIEMAIRTFVDPGDVILVERPTYSGGLRPMRAYKAEIADVEMDADGVLPEAFEQTVTRLVAAGKRPKLFYTMPTLHNPTGITTSVPRREAIVELCDRFVILIAEDDAYGEIRVEGQRPPSYYKIAGGQGALRLSTVSKMLATGLRIGWITGPKEIVDTFVRLRYDGGLSPFLVRTVAEFCVSGDEDRHLETVLPIYKEKRDRMLSALDERCARYASWTHPEGGFFVWVTLADAVDPAKLQDAMAQEKVIARPGTQFFAGAGGARNLRLCFSTATIPEIEEGIRRLGRAIEQAV